jgi:hypothetical protein
MRAFHAENVRSPGLPGQNLEVLARFRWLWVGGSGYKEDVMATADQVKAFIQSHADGDDVRFCAIAMQIAAQAARSGHGNFALSDRT